MDMLERKPSFVLTSTLLENKCRVRVQGAKIQREVRLISLFPRRFFQNVLALYNVVDVVSLPTWLSGLQTTRSQSLTFCSDSLKVPS